MKVTHTRNFIDVIDKRSSIVSKKKHQRSFGHLFNCRKSRKNALFLFIEAFWISGETRTGQLVFHSVCPFRNEKGVFHHFDVNLLKYMLLTNETFHVLFLN